MSINVQKFRKSCAYGRTHEIVVDDMVIEKGAIQRLPHIIKTYYSEYKTVAMLRDNGAYAAAGGLVEELLPGITTIRLSPGNLHTGERDVETAQKQLDKYAGVDFLITAGSGTIHDITRYHAYEKKLPFLSIPTAASMDGYISTATATTWHSFKRDFTAVSLRFMLADSEIFSKASLHLTTSGVASLLGKSAVLCNWRIVHALTGEYICDAVVDMEYKVLRGPCESLDGTRNHDLNAYEDLMYGLLLSDITIQIIGNSCSASGAEHHISHLWEVSTISEPIDYYHGEKVGVGLCMATTVYKEAEQKLHAGGYQVKDHMGLETKFIKANITGPVLQEEILKKDIPSLMTDITGSMLREKEADILTILADLPDAQTMIGWMRKVHGLATMQELTLNEALKATT